MLTSRVLPLRLNSSLEQVKVSSRRDPAWWFYVIVQAAFKREKLLRPTAHAAASNEASREEWYHLPPKIFYRLEGVNRTQT